MTGATANPAQRTPSLLFRLSASALVVVVLALSLIGLVVDRAFRAAEETALKERLEAGMFAVLSGLEVSSSGRLDWAGAPAESLLTQPQSGLYAGVRTAADQWLSPSTLGVEIALSSLPLERGEERFSVPGDDADWFVYRRGLGWEVLDDGIVDLVVWVAEDRSRIASSVASFRRDLWRWLALAAAVLVIAQFVLLWQPLLVLRRVAGEVRRVESGQQDRLSGVYPRELTPLTENLNALLMTERANAEQYSRALGDLAHALKTPLAVLNSQADAGQSLDAEEIRETVAQMQARIRAELDRAARSGRRTMLAPIAPAPVVERIVRSLVKLYPAVRFDVDVPSELRASIVERDLYELLGNLLENAAKYGGGRVRVSCRNASHGGRRPGLLIRVEDDGKGLSPEIFQRMLQRGVRGDERADGHGLGLAIVQRLAESYHGRIEAARSALGGLSVEVELRPE